jgi:predicted SprT family Zn-dependent metalloprotease
VQADQARSLALELMASHGLDGWTFGFDRAQRRLGACWLDRKGITLSRHFVELNGEELVRDVILHEIAHALTPGAGHGPRFKRKARELGCSGTACIAGSRVVAAPARFLLKCPNCGRSWSRYRRPARPLACSACLRDSPHEVRPLALHADPAI